MKRILPALAALIFVAPTFAQSQVTFADIDSDGNGALSLEEVQAVGVTEEQFTQFDTDGNDEWSEDEFYTAMGKSGESTSSPQY